MINKPTSRSLGLRPSNFSKSRRSINRLYRLTPLRQTTRSTFRSTFRSTSFTSSHNLRKIPRFIPQRRNGRNNRQIRINTQTQTQIRSINSQTRLTNPVLPLVVINNPPSPQQAQPQAQPLATTTTFAVDVPNLVEAQDFNKIFPQPSYIFGGRDMFSNYEANSFI